MRSIESHETVPCAGGACQSKAAPRAACCWHNEQDDIRRQRKCSAIRRPGARNAAAWHSRGVGRAGTLVSRRPTKKRPCLAVERIYARRSDCALARPCRTCLLELRARLWSLTRLVAEHCTYQRAALGRRCRANHQRV